MASGSRRKGRIFIYVALILILGLVLVWALVFRTMGAGGLSLVGVQPTPTQAIQTVDIVVTAQKITKGTAITEAQLTTIPYPKANFDAATFYTSVSDLVGKKSKIDLEPQVPVTSSLVLDKFEGSFAAYQIPKGMVAISVPITRFSSVSYAPQSGDHVNIIVTMQFVDLDTNFQSKLPNITAGVIPPGTQVVVSGGTQQSPSVTLTAVQQNQTTQIVGGGANSVVGRTELETGLGQPIYVVPSEAQRPRTVSQALVQDAIVLQVGNFALPGEANTLQPVVQPTAAPGQQQPAAAQPPAPEKPSIITLMVSPQDSITLNYLLFNNAYITLALRSTNDDSRVQTEAVTLQYLMDQYNIPVPAKLPYGVANTTDGSTVQLPQIEPMLSGEKQPTAVPQ